MLQTVSAPTPGVTSPFLSVRQVVRRFGAFTALDGVSLDVAQGEFVCLLGPSGCGKTTLLRIIAGLEAQDAGRIVAGGRDISRLPPRERDYGIVFQSYALFPNLTVAQNVAYGLAAANGNRARMQARVAEMLALVGLAGSEAKYPAQLSGGQQQRVALARALAPAPSLLLLDEPMSALDAQVREHLRVELRRLQRRLNVTTLMVTHDQDEAMAMADRIAVMCDGRIEQTGTPAEIYTRPATGFVAGFVGQANWLPLQCADDGTPLLAGQPLLLDPAFADYGGMTLLVLCTVLHCATAAHLTAVAALGQLDPVFEAVSASLKVSALRTYWRVTLPMCLPAVLACARYLFVSAMTTVSAVIFLYSPDTVLASVAVLNMDDAGDIGPAAAMSTLILLTSIVVALLLELATRGVVRRTQAWRTTQP
ncbi:ATP-binding cassette domain-containing protein [Ralstonia solanacearum]|uniref:ATP-binding cassette domain-containing protein n=1 Tax=Ralstonia solanacearum TaxID=305 RepID=UPI0009C14772|nr:ATP-binding cassette domain-containing protein [Ralstonia solanacearum]